VQTRFWGPAAIAAAITLLGPVARGDAPAETTLAEEMLEELCAAGKIPAARCDELREKAKAEKTAAAQIPQVDGEEPTDWKAYWKNGLRIQRNDKLHSLTIGGRIMLDAAAIHQDNDITEHIVGGAAIGRGGTGVEFRRARLFVSGTLYERLIFKAQYDFADGEADFTDVYMGLKGVPALGTVRVGHFKQPFGLEQLTSSKYIVFMERSGQAMEEGRNTGIGANNSILADRMTWAAGAFRVTDKFGDGFGSGSNYNVGLRLTGLPWAPEDETRLLHLGASYFHGFRNSADGQRFRQRPETHQASFYVDTGTIPSDGGGLLGAEAALVCGPFSLQSEYLYTFLDQDGASDVDFWAAYVHASAFLTGESRAYDRKQGVFTRISPKHNFDPENGHWGAFQIAGRFSYVDLDDKNVKGGKLRDVTAGLNWYLFPNARIMLNYIWAHLENVGDSHISQMRFQIDF
jgi:phosphate-selective porin OprO/OprP